MWDDSVVFGKPDVPLEQTDTEKYRVGLHLVELCGSCEAFKQGRWIRNMGVVYEAQRMFRPRSESPARPIVRVNYV
jgi:hypothetical protein